MVVQHSPLPWSLRFEAGHVFADEKLIAGCMGHQDNFTPDLRETNKANAAFIVRACNAHDELLAALKTAVEVILVWHSIHDADDAAWDIYRQHAPEMQVINAAIAKAEAE